MSNLEKKFGKFAIKNLTMYLIMGYILGYVITLISNARGIDFIGYLTLDPTKIIQGQVWRLVSWVIIPPSDYSGFMGFMFLLLMMYCCYSIGTVLERTWGTLKYNIYILGGIGLTILGAFASLGILCLNHAHFGTTVNDILQSNLLSQFRIWDTYSTYFINMSIYMGFALTYPDNMVRLMFFIPIKMKWLGIIDAIYFAYYLYTGGSMAFNGYRMSYYGGEPLMNYAYFALGLFSATAVLAAVINIFLFWLVNIKRFSAKQAARRAKFKREYNAGVNQSAMNNGRVYSVYSQQAPGGNGPRMRGITKHKCAVCGQSEQDNPDLEFRFCSKCNGAYEYCQNHLFSHVHKL